MAKKFIGLKKLAVRDMVLLAMLISVSVVLERYVSINTPIVRVSFSFIANVAGGVVFGPFWTGIMAVIADFIGSFLSGYAPFLPISLCKFLYGFAFGVMLYNYKHTFKNILICVLVQNVIVSLFVMSYFLTFLYETPFEAILVSRLILVAVTIPVQTAVTMLLCRYLAPQLLSIYNKRV